LIGLRKFLAVALVVYAVGALVFLVFGYSGGSLLAEDIYFIPAITGTVVGAYLTIKRPENRMGPLMAVMAAALVTLGVSNALVPFSLEQGGAGLVVAAVHLSDVAWISQFITALVLLPLWFPTGRPIDHRWAWVGRTAIGAALASEISFILSESVCAYESTLAEECVLVDNPWGIEGFTGFEPVMLVAFAMAIPALASTFFRWRRSDDVERHQIKWFFVAAVALLVAFVFSYLEFDETINNILFALALTAVWASIAIAVLKYRLYEIDRIISRTVAYAVVIAVLGAVYVGLVTAIGSRFESSLSVAASTLAVAALFNPLRKRVQGWVDRHFNRSSYDTEQVMDEFAGSLRDEVDADEVVDGWIDVVEETMQPSSVGIWIRP